MTRLLFIDTILNNLQSTFWQIVLLIALVVIIIALIKFPNARVYIFTILLICLVGLGAYSGIMLNSYYSAEGGIIGTIHQFVNPTQVEIVDELKFNFTGIEMRSVTETRYRASTSTTDIVNVPVGSSYVLLVNDLPCNVSESDSSSDYLIANYMYTFMDENRDEILTDTLVIRIAFNNLNTTISLETNGGSECASLWNAFFNKNGFELTLTTDRYVDTNTGLDYGTGDTSNYAVVTFVNKEEITYEVYTLGSEINLPVIDDIEFIGWSYNDNYINNDFIVNEDIVLEAVYFEFQPGLYVNGVLTSSWDELLFNNRFTLSEDGELGRGKVVSSALIGDLILPDSVISIGNSAFNGYSNLTSIMIPNSVISIGVQAFNRCSGLTSVTIGDSVTSIGNYAFTACSSLVSITIPDSVTSIGSYAFQSCNNLTSVTISGNLSSIGDSAFICCANLTAVTIASEYVYTNLTSSVSSCGYLGEYATTIKVLKTIVDDISNINTYLNNTSNFTRTLDDDGLYYTYTKLVSE